VPEKIINNNKKRQTKRQNEPKKANEETSKCETGTGQQVAQLHDIYMMMMMIIRYENKLQSPVFNEFT
jgi:hypothetical protein